MSKQHLITALIAASIAGPATAEGLSFGVDFAMGAWANHSTETGIEDKEQRTTGKLGLSVASDFGMFVGQVDLNIQGLGHPSNGDEDATSGLVDVTLRGMRDFGGFRAGLFLGKGEHDDFGDTPEYMSYQFIGFDVEKDTSFGKVYGQIGYLDSRDEYDEGIERANFLRVGADYQLASGLVANGALSVANGRRWGSDDYDAKVLGVELGLAKAMGDSGLWLYGSYEHTLLMTTGGGYSGYGDEFGTLWVGLKYDFGGDTKRGTKLPNLGQWVAYNANEIE